MCESHLVPVVTLKPESNGASWLIVLHTSKLSYCGSKWLDCHPKLRAVPEIILGGATFFFRPLHPQETQGVRAPRPPGHVSALINPPHYGSNMPWPPGQVTPPPPTPRTHCQQNTLPPPDKKVSAAHPTLRIISGTALMCTTCLPWKHDSVNSAVFSASNLIDCALDITGSVLP